MSIATTLDLETRSEANMREHHHTKAARAKKQREAVTAKLLEQWGDGAKVLPVYAAPHVQVTLTRLASRDLDDDNLAGAFKAVRDAIAKWFGVDDGPKGPCRWRYAQERRTGPQKKLGGVRIEIARAPRMLSLQPVNAGPTPVDPTDPRVAEMLARGDVKLVRP